MKSFQRRVRYSSHVKYLNHSLADKVEVPFGVLHSMKIFWKHFLHSSTHFILEIAPRFWTKACTMSLFSCPYSLMWTSSYSYLASCSSTSHSLSIQTMNVGGPQFSKIFLLDHCLEKRTAAEVAEQEKILEQQESCIQLFIHSNRWWWWKSLPIEKQLKNCRR